MARIRTVKPEAFSDEGLATVSFAARWFFAGLWTEADDKGRLLDSPKYLAGAIFPHEEAMTAAKVKRLIDELERIGAAKRYEADGKKLLWLPHFLDHQRISHPTPSKLPAHPEDDGKTPEPPPRGSRETPETLANDSRVEVEVGSGSGNGSPLRNGKRSSGASPVSLHPAPSAEHGPKDPNINGKATELADRMAACCKGRGPKIRAEAIAVVAHCLAHVDWRLVDETVGWAEKADKPPVMPRYFLPAVRRKAAELGVLVPLMDGEREAS